VRAEAREPGGPLVECAPGAGNQAVIIEDVVASGGSAARATRALLEETSLRVAGIQSIANWNFPEMRDLLAPWTVRAVTSYPQVLDSARAVSISDCQACGNTYYNSRNTYCSILQHLLQNYRSELLC
jgi:orotate phosphoribosyltransferase